MTSEWENITDYELMDNELTIDNDKDNNNDNENIIDSKKPHHKCKCLNYLGIVLNNLKKCISKTINDIKQEQQKKIVNKAKMLFVNSLDNNKLTQTKQTKETKEAIDYNELLKIHLRF